MEFHGGVIVIGSLLWDLDSNRCNWREKYLQSLYNKIPVSLRIRYGRLSRSRKDTYSMIFSNHSTTEFGQAFIIPFREPIKNEEYIESQAFALAKAEGLWTPEKPSLNKSWGTVGLNINPKIKEEGGKSAEIILKHWIELYKNYNFNIFDYSIKDELPVVDSNGIMQIGWTKEMNDFDFLIGTTLVPIPKRTLNAKEIAQKMIENNYREYFDNNLKHNIRTFQDDDILNELDKINRIK